MARAQVEFYRIVLDSDDYESFELDENQMVARIVFTLAIDGRRYNNMCVEARQPYETRFEQNPIEISRPTGPYQGNWNLDEFAQFVERYYRNAIGSSGQPNSTDGDSDTRIRNTTLSPSETVEFDIPD
jgi:hypothetical protein